MAMLCINGHSAYTPICHVMGDNSLCRYENGFQFILSLFPPVCQMMQIRYCAQEIHFVYIFYLVYLFFFSSFLRCFPFHCSFAVWSNFSIESHASNSMVKWIEDRVRKMKRFWPMISALFSDSATVGNTFGQLHSSTLR